MVDKVLVSSFLRPLVYVRTGDPLIHSFAHVSCAYVRDTDSAIGLLVVVGDS